MILRNKMALPLSRFGLCCAVPILLGMTESAMACTVDLKRGETVDEFRARHLKKARVIKGSLLAVDRQDTNPDDLSGVRLLGPESPGKVTDAKGRTFPVTFRPPGPWLVDGTACGIFTLPEGQVARGTFYLIRERGKAYHLLHYIPASER